MVVRRPVKAQCACPIRQFMVRAMSRSASARRSPSLASSMCAYHSLVHLRPGSQDTRCDARRWKLSWTERVWGPSLRGYNRGRGSVTISTAHAPAPRPPPARRGDDQRLAPTQNDPLRRDVSRGVALAHETVGLDAMALASCPAARSVKDRGIVERWRGTVRAMSYHFL